MITHARNIIAGENVAENVERIRHWMEFAPETLGDMSFTQIGTIWCTLSEVAMASREPIHVKQQAVESLQLMVDYVKEHSALECQAVPHV